MRILNHLTHNSVQAITGLDYLLGPQILAEYDGPPGRILYTTAQDDGLVTIDILDNGPGINPADIEQFVGKNRELIK